MTYVLRVKSRVRFPQDMMRAPVEMQPAISAEIPSRPNGSPFRRVARSRSVCLLPKITTSVSRTVNSCPSLRMARAPPRLSRLDFMRLAARVSTCSSFIVQERNMSEIFSISSSVTSISLRCRLRSFAEPMAMGCALVSADLG